MSTSIFILHGSFGSPFENWFPWLHNAQSALGKRCFAPSFPTPDGQTFATWSSILDAYRDTALLNKDSVIIAHSSAAAFAAKYISSRKITVKQLITVSGFNQFLSGNEDFDKINSEFFSTNQELALVSDYCDDILCIFSESDPYLPLEVLKSFAKAISGTMLEVPDAGHFNSASGYSEFPKLLEFL